VVPLLILPVLVVVSLIALVPISIVQRYRMGTSRQRARGWLASINLAALSLSAVMFLAGAAVTSVWVPGAFTYSAAGFATGCVLGMIGLCLTRWESAPGSLHFTPSRSLVLVMTLVVTARLLYGFWRGVHAWRAGVEGAAWSGAAGLAGSMAAGGVVLGYYLAYWIGVRRRFRRQMIASGPGRR
jgi:hypothetical protein